ncbi:hypothetical protein BSIN_5190 [Burkholderia singularis]|uniref:Uncharacterized protein n=1 Tax=Burkholderia singularis TaxID=1503053 RepID=A0A238HBT1_9BURK|nr:hypothetical protein BSIN_5190 [Burkholderia singularis]
MRSGPPSRASHSARRHRSGTRPIARASCRRAAPPRTPHNARQRTLAGWQLAGTVPRALPLWFVQPY